MGAIVVVFFAAAEYLLAVAIGLPTTLAVIVALQVGIIAVMLVWLAGAPGSGCGLGGRW